MHPPEWLKVDSQDILLIAQIKTGQKQSKIQINNENLIIFVTSQPVKGKANKEILRLLKKQFKKEIRLERGETSTKKVFRIKSAKYEDILEKIKSLYDY
ncbi:MAG: hypothetical protein EAX86_01110 [Candidatus Heimdallarchaeota archaeon]|nr:hypothetical protein [Candidatus Heimdallarchaeota archaeon]